MLILRQRMFDYQQPLGTTYYPAMLLSPGTGKRYRRARRNFDPKRLAEIK